MQDTYVVTPSVVPVPDNSGAQRTSWVDACARDGNGGQVDQEYCEPNGERCQQLQATRLNRNFSIDGI